MLCPTSACHVVYLGASNTHVTSRSIPRLTPSPSNSHTCSQVRQELAPTWLRALSLVQQLAASGKQEYLERLCAPGGALSLIIPHLFSGLVLQPDAAAVTLVAAPDHQHLELLNSVLEMMGAVVARAPAAFGSSSGTGALAAQELPPAAYFRLCVVAKACCELVQQLLASRSQAAGPGGSPSKSVLLWPPGYAARACRLLRSLLLGARAGDDSAGSSGSSLGPAACGVGEGVREMLLGDGSSGLEELRVHTLGAHIKSMAAALGAILKEAIGKVEERAGGSSSGSEPRLQAMDQPLTGTARPQQAADQLEVYGQILATYTALARAGSGTLVNGGNTLEEVARLPFVVGHRLGPVLLPALRLLELAVVRGAESTRGAVRKAAPRLVFRLLTILAQPQRLRACEAGEGVNASGGSGSNARTEFEGSAAAAGGDAAVAAYSAVSSLLCRILAPAESGGLGVGLQPTCMPHLVGLLKCVAQGVQPVAPGARNSSADPASDAVTFGAGGEGATISSPARGSTSGAASVSRTSTDGPPLDHVASSPGGGNSPFSLLLTQAQLQHQQQAVARLLDTLTRVLHTPASHTHGNSMPGSPGASGSNPGALLVGAGAVGPLMALIRHESQEVARSAAEVLAVLAANPAGCRALLSAAPIVVDAVTAVLGRVPAQRLVVSITAAAAAHSSRTGGVEGPAVGGGSSQDVAAAAGDSAQQAASRSSAGVLPGYLTTADLAVLLTKRPVVEGRQGPSVPPCDAPAGGPGSATGTPAAASAAAAGLQDRTREVAPMRYGTRVHPPWPHSACVQESEVVEVVGEADNAGKLLPAAATSGRPVSEVELDEVQRDRASVDGRSLHAQLDVPPREVRLSLTCEHAPELHWALLRLLTVLLDAQVGWEALQPCLTGNTVLLQEVVKLLRSLSDKLAPVPPDSSSSSSTNVQATAPLIDHVCGTSAPVSVYLAGKLHDTALMALDLLALVASTSVQAEQEAEAAASLEATATGPESAEATPIATTSPTASALVACAAPVLISLLSPHETLQHHNTSEDAACRRALVTRASRVLCERANSVPGFASAAAHHVVAQQDEAAVRAWVAVLRDAQPPPTSLLRTTRAGAGRPAAGVSVTGADATAAGASMPPRPGAGSGGSAGTVAAAAACAPCLLPEGQRVLRGALRLLLRVCRADGGLSLTAAEAGAVVAAMVGVSADSSWCCTFPAALTALQLSA